MVAAAAGEVAGDAAAAEAVMAAAVVAAVTAVAAAPAAVLEVAEAAVDVVLAALGAAGDAAANKAKMDELTAKVAEIRANLPKYYTNVLEADATNYDALYQLGAYYYNDAQEIKRLVNSMDMNEYKKTGKEVEAKLAVKYNEALP
jgi:hypothetical protein